MKTIPASMQAHLDGGATTLCWCWRLLRRDGMTLGFTDHDRVLVFDGTTFEAMSGFTASEIKESVGLSVDNLEVAGALSSQSLNDDDLAAGLYDDAGIEIFRVNWADPTQRVLMRSGSIGEVKRSGTAFAAEVRGLAHYLQQPKGRLYQYGCDADLGDGRCGVDLSGAAFKGAGAVTALTSARVFAVSGLGAFAGSWFQRGLLTWSTGANAGLSMEIKRHENSGGAVELELWQAMAKNVLAGDQFTITAGCDKLFETCKTKFANVNNFRGFPHMPGNDFVTSNAGGDGNDDGAAR